MFDMNLNTKVVGFKRAKSSTLGNPAFILITADGSEYRTQANTAAAYEVENVFSFASESAPLAVTLVLTKAGTIRYWL